MYLYQVVNSKNFCQAVYHLTDLAIRHKIEPDILILWQGKDKEIGKIFISREILEIL